LPSRREVLLHDSMCPVEEEGKKRDRSNLRH
jgi:hypothetical protein